jgi:predicted TIM-barrel fold metal-dependent hydrolase
MIEPRETDQRIWEDELAEFVPQRVYDVHSHIYRWEFNTDPNKENGPYSFVGERFPNADWASLDACDRSLMPGRLVHRLAFPFPFSPSCDFAASNRFIAEQVHDHPKSAALMVVHPSMPAEYLDDQIRRYGFVGFKPYRTYSLTGDAVECRITDFLPQHQIELADRYGLLIMMHLSKRNAIADPQNIEDLRRLSAEFPQARWILAHCGRSYSAWAIERAAAHVRDLPNVWYDTSSVCESDAFDALFSTVGPDRVMYGSDDMPVGVLRGKYIAFGHAWTYLSEQNHSFSLAHCDSSMTFTRYEQLRAMLRGARRMGLTPLQIQALFFDTAFHLVDEARLNLAKQIESDRMNGLPASHFGGPVGERRAVDPLHQHD